MEELSIFATSASYILGLGYACATVWNHHVADHQTPITRKVGICYLAALIGLATGAVGSDVSPVMSGLFGLLGAGIASNLAHLHRLDRERPAADAVQVVAVQAAE
jgi:hypothetical protein